MRGGAVISHMLGTELNGAFRVANTSNGSQIEVRGLGALGLALYKTLESCKGRLIFPSAFGYPCLENRKRRVELKFIKVKSLTAQAFKLCD
jgi:hypothetical protein